MTAWTLVARRLSGATLLTVAVACGMAWLASAVERAGGAQAAWRLVPGVIALVLPLLCGLGAVAASVQMDRSGERGALEAAGWSPARTGRAAFCVGAAFGLLGFVVQGWIGPAVAPLDSSARWVSTPRGPLRLADGVVVRAGGDDEAGIYGLVDVWTAGPERAAAIQVGLASQQPQRASWSDLRASPGTAATLEQWARVGRALGCGCMGLLGWLPWFGPRRWQPGAVLAGGLVWQLAAQASVVAGGQGWAPPAVAGVGPALALGVWALASALRSR